MFWRGVLGYLPANIIQGVVGFLAIIVYTRLLSAEDFGRYALAFSVMTMAHVATFSWLEAAMARFWAAQRDGADMASHFASLYRTVFIMTGLFLPLRVWSSGFGPCRTVSACRSPSLCSASLFAA